MRNLSTAELYLLHGLSRGFSQVIDQGWGLSWKFWEGSVSKMTCLWLDWGLHFLAGFLAGSFPQLLAPAAAAKSLQSCLTLCDPIDGSPPGSSVPGILQAKILEWVAISFSNACMHDKSLQSCPTLCNPMDSSPPGTSVDGILSKNTGVGCHFLLQCMHAW